MVVFRYQIISASSKSTIYELIVIWICNNKPHAEIRIHKPNVFLIEEKQNNVLSYSRRNLLTKNFLIFL